MILCSILFLLFFSPYIDSWSLYDISNGSFNDNYPCFVVFKHGGNSLNNLILLTDMSLLMTFLSDFFSILLSIRLTFHIEYAMEGRKYITLDNNSP